MTTIVEEKQLTEVSFEEKTLELLSILSNINSKIMLTKINGAGDFKIDSASPDKAVAYRFVTSIENFQFEGDEVGFYDYQEFYKLLTVFEEPELKQDKSKFQIVQDKSKIEYFVADPEAIPPAFKNIDFEDPEITFKLTSGEIANIKKMISIIGDTSDVRLSVIDGEMELKVFNGARDNTYQETFEIEKGKNEEGYSVVILSKIFSVLPEGDFDIQIKDIGLVRFVCLNEGYDLELFTGENVED